MNTLRLTILFDRLGPYHHARLNSVGREARVSAIELSGVNPPYSWETVKGATRYARLTLFHDKAIDAQPTRSIVHQMTIALETAKPQVVAIPGWSSRGSLAALYWCQKNLIPAIVMSESTIHDQRRKQWKEALKRRVVRLCSASLCGGKAHRDYLNMLGVSQQRIFTGYDVVDNDYFAARADVARKNAEVLRNRLDIPEHYFLASSRFVEKKNLVRLLQAYASYRERANTGAWKLILLGDGPLKPQLVNLITQLGVANHVLLPGFKQYENLPIYYGLAGAFVHASTVEQWGLVVNEAMAAGLPVIVSKRCGCVPELVENGHNGFTFDPHDVGALASLMEKIASDRCDRQAMCRASRYIINRWCPRTFANGLLDAVNVALNLPCPEASLLDKALLWGLVRR